MTLLISLAALLLVLGILVVALYDPDPPRSEWELIARGGSIGFEDRED